MTAVRLRGTDAIERALQARQMHLDDSMTITEIAEAYGATERAVYDWLQLAKKHTLPDLDDKQAWFKLILQDQGARLEDSKDTDSVAISKNLQQLLGVGSAEELKQHMARLETAKVAIVARAFDDTIADLPNRRALRAAFLDALDTHEPALTD